MVGSSAAVVAYFDLTNIKVGTVGNLPAPLLFEVWNIRVFIGPSVGLKKEKKH